MAQMNLFTKQKQTHRLRELTYGYQGGREGIVWELGIDMYTLIYLKLITNQDLLHSTGNSAQCYVEACMGREFGGEWIHVYIWQSHFTVHLKLKIHC